MTKSFKEFVVAYRDGSITEDAAWRAYDIEGMAADGRAAQAAVPLVNIARQGFGRNRDNEYSDVAARYGLNTAVQAQHLLGLWFVWRQIACGHRPRGLTLREPAASPLPVAVGGQTEGGATQGTPPP